MTMRHTTLLIVAAALGTASHADAGIRTITEDFTDPGGAAAFDPELNFDFGTATDFTGDGRLERPQCRRAQSLR